jgi:hypothetical protein
MRRKNPHQFSGTMLGSVTKHIHEHCAVTKLPEVVTKVVSVTKSKDGVRRVVGRPAKHGSAAERQRAYRERQKVV